MMGHLDQFQCFTTSRCPPRQAAQSGVRSILPPIALRYDGLSEKYCLTWDIVKEPSYALSWIWIDMFSLPKKRPRWVTLLDIRPTTLEERWSMSV